jgi:hypothetical protein
VTKVDQPFLAGSCNIPGHIRVIRIVGMNITITNFGALWSRDEISGHLFAAFLALVVHHMGREGLAAALGMLGRGGPNIRLDWVMGTSTLPKRSSLLQEG